MNLATNRRGAKGFTLLEVIVALAILGLSLAVLLGIFSQSLERSRAGTNEDGARVLAQSLLAESAHAPAREGEGDAEGGLHWKVRVAPYGSDSDAQSWAEALETVSVVVSWREERRTRRFVLSTLRLAPKAGAP